MAEEKFKVFIDGSSLGNPGPGGAAYVIEDPRGRVIREGWCQFESVTNNQAEYEAVVLALEECRKLKIYNIEILTDSELLYSQLTGKYRVKSPKLIPIFQKTKRMLSRLDWSVKRIGREENRRADQLAYMAAFESSGI